MAPKLEMEDLIRHETLDTSTDSDTSSRNTSIECGIHPSITKLKPSQQQQQRQLPPPDNTTDNTTTTNNSGGGATVFQTSLNVGKLCMGTGTLALPFAAEKGGLLFNIVGLGLIGLWNYYSANCLLRCLEFLPRGIVDNDGGGGGGGDDDDAAGHGAASECQLEYGTMDSNYDANNGEQHEKYYKHTTVRKIDLMPPPPDGTTTYGAVAWYAAGPKGLMVLDMLMMSLYFGLVIAYEVAMQSFINDTPITTGSKRIDLLIPSALIAIVSCAPDIGFLSKFSGMGLLAVGLSFAVISWQGFEEHGVSGFKNSLELNLWPESLSAASSWFGVVVFGYGVAPFVFNFRNSMIDPNQINTCLQLGISLVYAGYISMSNGIRVLFSPGGRVFDDGDVFQAMPHDTWISIFVRLLMTFVVAVTAPLIVVPCGELIEGKLGLLNNNNNNNNNSNGSQHEQQCQRPSSSMRVRIAVRVTFCIVCTLFAEFFSSGFVHIVSFIGCFCVSIVGFVLPPLFAIQLSNQHTKMGRRSSSSSSSSGEPNWNGDVGNGMFLCDAAILAVGVAATVITSTLTFRELMIRAEME